MDKEKSSVPDQGMKYANDLQQLLIALCISLIILMIITENLFLDLTSLWFYMPFFYVYSCSIFMVMFTHTSSIYLDRHCKWEEQIKKRIVFQFLLGCMTPFILCGLVAHFYFKYLGVSFWAKDYFRYLALLVILVLLLLNVIYAFSYMFYFFSNKLTTGSSITSNKKDSNQKTKGKNVQAYDTELIFKQGWDIITVNVNEISYICCHGKYSALFFLNKDTIVLNIALTKIKKRLDPAVFYQVNRSYIVTRPSVLKIKSIKNAKELFLNPPHKERIKINNHNAAIMSNWMDSNNIAN